MYSVQTRDHARVLVNRVNTCVGHKVLKQPTKRDPNGWTPTFKRGGTLKLPLGSVAKGLKPQVLATVNGEACKAVTVQRKRKIRTH